MSRFVYKFTPKDAATFSDDAEYLKALRGLEKVGYADNTKATNVIDENRAAIDEIVGGSIRPALFEALEGGEEGKLAEQVRNLDRKGKEKSIGKTLAARLFGANKFFKKEQPPLAGDKDFKDSYDDAVGASTNREVLMGAVYDPEKVWHSDILKNLKVTKFLSEHVSGDWAKDPKGDAVLTYALNFMLSKVHGGGDKLDAEKALKFLKAAFGVHEGHDIADIKSDFDGIKHEYGEIQSIIQKIEAIMKSAGNKTIAEILQGYSNEINGVDGAAGLKKKMNDAEEAYDKVDQKIQTTDTKDTGYAALQREGENKKKAFDKAKESYDKVDQKKKELTELTNGLGHAAHEFYDNAKDFNHHKLADGSSILEDGELAALKGLSDKSNAHDGHAANPDQAIAIFKEKGKDKFQGCWKKFTKNSESYIKENDAGAHKHETGKVTSSEFLYKVYFKYISTKPEDGGGAGKDDDVKNPVYLQNKREEARYFVPFAISDAKDMTVFAANKTRCEALSRGVLSWRERAKFLPDFNKILETFRFLSNTEGRPFAKLHIKKDTSRAEFRKMIKKGELKESDIPLLVAHLQKILDGYENKYVRPADVPYVMAMIRTLRHLRLQEKIHSITEGGGSFDDKLKALLAEDNAVDDARKGIDESTLFTMITDKNIVKKEKAKIAKEIRDKVASGELSVTDAMKQMKENAMDPGRGTFARLVAIRSGANIKRHWKNIKGKGPIAWTINSAKGAWGSLKKFPSWLGGTRLGKAWDYSTTGDNYFVNPLKHFSGGHGHGGGHEEGGGAHGGGAAHGGGH